MSDCCGNHDNHKSNKKEEANSEKPPKSVIGRWLYNYGKKLEEKDRLKEKHKGGCC